MKLSSLIISAGALLAACTTQGSPVGPAGDPITGRYDVIILVDDGRRIEGTMDLILAPDSMISGTKSLLLRNGASTDITPLLEHGRISGRLALDGVRIELNPDYADYNFGVAGSLGSGSITGPVIFDGLIGGDSHPIGFFQARRR
jgi:hypothetical protein